MKLFVGLGNPGPKYANNRHNIGFMAVEAIADGHGFGPGRSKFQAQVSEGVLGGEKVLLLKPDTFMNLSGQAVGEAMRFYKLDSTDVTVFHDELDLVPGKLKLKLGGGHAGHNGLRSIHQHIGPHYARVRLGIGHPGHKDKVSPWVLSDFAKQEYRWLDDMMRGISDGAEYLVTDDNAKFTNAVALRMNPNGAAPKPAATREQRLAKKTPEPASPPDPEPDGGDRSALQKLIDKFK
ncbi:MAG TPA: aminoacyl-tRNA hydrolase [Maritimibacter sp.]|nr:aminoacyl-tRNA hydrolase [Maritimibacter sp.]